MRIVWSFMRSISSWASLTVHQRFVGTHAFAILLALCTTISAADSIPSFAFALSGFDALRYGDYSQALADIRADASIVDTGVRLFKLGVISAKAGSNDEAMFYLRMAAQKSPRVAPLAYQCIGDLCAARHDRENAIHAYRAALSLKIPPRYDKYLRKRIYEVLKSDSTLAARMTWLVETEAAVPQEDNAWALELLDTLLVTEQWTLADSIARQYLASAEKEGRCQVLSMLSQHHFPDSLFSTQRLFELAQMAYSCARYESAQDWFQAAALRSDFAQVVDGREALRFPGQIAYRLGNASSALRWFDKYEKKYGLTPEIVISVARSYRKLRKTGKANIWYDRLVEMYPRHSLAGDVLWYRAWQREEDGQFADAIRRYATIIQRQPRGDRAQEASFRIALCRYKDSSYEASLAGFSTFARKNASSSLAMSANYWKARSLLALKREAESRPVLLEICASAPWDYYAYRSRELLINMGDTSCALSFDSAGTIGRARAWVDSIQKGKSLRSEDSAAWFSGALLAFSGMVEQAELFIKPLELRYPANLSLQFDIALLYDMCGDPKLSFRVGRRFAWRIPQQWRARMPLTLYGMMFPLPYQDRIVDNALRVRLDPLLVCSVMRQESIFDSVIVSPVGAIGLMQIMPYTGEEIAGELGESFRTDALYSPDTNIRYGAWYLRHLLDKFDDEVVWAIASYNGGPHNAVNWREQSKNMTPDMAIETIGFSETREYVKKVLANYWTYRKLAPALGYPGG